MATQKLNKDALIKKALKAVRRELGVSNETPKARRESFNAKSKAVPMPLLYCIKERKKAFLAVVSTFFSLGFVVARLMIPVEPMIHTASATLDYYDFNAFDSDKDGELNLAEAQKAKKALVARRFHFSDKNHDGWLCFEESQKAFSVSYEKFTSLDANGDEHLSFEESDQDIGQMNIQQFEQLDKNNNGKLNFAEAHLIYV